MSKDAHFYLLLINEAISRMKNYTKDGRSKFFESPLIQDAVIYNFEKISDAAGKIPESLKEQHTGIPWEELSMLRRVLLYPDLNLVWNTVERLDALRDQLDKIPP